MFLVELLVAGTVAVAAWAVGRVLLRASGVSTGNLSTRLTVSMGLGLAAIVYLQVILGFAGAFSRTQAWALVGGLLALGMLGLWRWRPNPPTAAALPGLRLLRTHWPYAAMSVTFAVYAVAYLLVALAPTLEGDSMAGYLLTAREYAKQGGIVSVEYAYTNPFPANGQMLSSLGYLLKGQIVAQLLLTWTMGLVAAATVYAVGRTWLSRRAGITGAAVWYGMTSVAVISASGKIDLAWAAFDLLALLAFGHWYFAEKGRRDWRWLLIAGLFLGVAGGVKQASVFTAGVLALGMAYRLWSDRASWSTTWLASYGAIALLALPAIVWVGRSFALTDTPGFSGTNLNRDSGFFGFFNAVWDASMLGNSDSSEGPNGKSIGPTMLAIIPAAALFRRVDPRLWHLLGFAAIMLVAWFLTVQRARHLFPTLGLLAVASGYVLAIMVDSRPVLGRALMVVVVGALAVSFATWGYVNFVSLDTVTRALNIKTDDEFFERNLPKFERYPNAAVVRFFRDESPRSTVVASPANSNGLYLDRPLHPEWSQTERRAPDPVEFAATLRDSGITHVYVNDFVVGERNLQAAWLARPDFQARFLTKLFCQEGQCVYELK